MAPKLFAIEFGLGLDLHGQDVTKAAVKAVRNAVEHVSLPGIRKVGGVTDTNNQVSIEILLGVPEGMAGQVDQDRVKDALPFGRKSVRVATGGLMASSGVEIPTMGDTSDQAIAVVAAITATIDVEG